jgi:hypothetical protein
MPRMGCPGLIRSVDCDREAPCHIGTLDDFHVGLPEDLRNGGLRAIQ